MNGIEHYPIGYTMPIQDFTEKENGVKLWKKAIKGTRGVKFKISRDGQIKGGWSCWIRGSLKDISQIISIIHPPDEITLFTNERWQKYEVSKGDVDQSRDYSHKDFPRFLKNQYYVDPYTWEAKEMWWDKNMGIFGTTVYKKGGRVPANRKGEEVCTQFPEEHIDYSYTNHPSPMSWLHKPIALLDDGKLKKGKHFYANLRWER